MDRPSGNPREEYIVPEIRLRQLIMIKNPLFAKYRARFEVLGLEEIVIIAESLFTENEKMHRKRALYTCTFSYFQVNLISSLHAQSHNIFKKASRYIGVLRTRLRLICITMRVVVGIMQRRTIYKSYFTVQRTCMCVCMWVYMSVPVFILIIHKAS